MSTLPYLPTPASPEQITGGLLPVQMAVPAAARQRRVTVLFRVLTVIPHGIALYFLGLAAGVVAFIGWWAALFTGRLPEFAQTYLTGYIQWYTRVQAYLMLLTDVFPPFSLEDEPGYPVRVAVPPATSLNRLAVFFRVILVFPVAMLAAIVVMGGMTIVAFIAWLITLITGELPAGLHLAYTAIIRYVTRVNCYFYLLTPVYPGGLLGDGPAAMADGAVPSVSDLPPAGDFGGRDAAGSAAADYTGTGYVAPGYAAFGDYAVPAGYGTPAGYSAPGGYGAPASPADWRLVLTADARQLVSLFIGIGVVLWIAWIAVVALVASIQPPRSSVAVPAGYQRVGGAAQGISVAAPSSWVEVNLATSTIESGLKKAGLRGVSASTLTQMMESLQTLHPVLVIDVPAAAANPQNFAPNLNAYCVTSGVTDVGSAGVPFLKATMAAEFAKLATHVSQQYVEIGGVPGVQTSYQLSSSSAGTIYGSQLEVLPQPDKVCFVTVTAGNGELPDSVLRVAAATAQFP